MDAEDKWHNQASPVGQAPEDEALAARPHPVAEVPYADTTSPRLAAAGPQVVPGPQTAVAGESWKLPPKGSYTQAEVDACFTPVLQHGFNTYTRNILDIDYFRRYEVPNPYVYKQHNGALTWFRELAEAAGEDALAFSNTGVHSIPELVHAKGTEYYFDRGGTLGTWRWQGMVAQMDEP